MNIVTVQSNMQIFFSIKVLVSNVAHQIMRCVISSIISFSHWMQYHLEKIRKKNDLKLKMMNAAIHYKHRILRVHIQQWKVSFAKLRKCLHFSKHEQKLLTEQILLRSITKFCILNILPVLISKKTLHLARNAIYLNLFRLYCSFFFSNSVFFLQFLLSLSYFTAMGQISKR